MIHTSTVNSAVGTLSTASNVNDRGVTVIVLVTGFHRLVIMVRYLNGKTFLQ